MSSSSHPRHIQRALTPAAAALVLLGLAVTPAAAHPEAGAPVVHAQYRNDCPLRRVGTQFVRCDDLTGNNVPAPAYIPER
jgi:hypothetical protein